MIHQLKIKSKYFSDIVSGKKQFELRFNDRDYRVGDYIALNELNATMDGYSRRSVLAKIDYILDHSDMPEAIKENWVIIGFTVCDIVEPEEKNICIIRGQERLLP